MTPTPARIAVLVPCYNEAATIAKVVADFRVALPQATVFVYDNNSSDGTAFIAHGAGAVVRSECLQGKGFVVRRMFADVEADIYVMVDGDDTYEAAAAPKLIEALLMGPNDMVAAARVPTVDQAYRPGHQFGNWLLTGLVAAIFGKRTNDMLTGYRVFSRRFVKTFPALSGGFEIETELTVHALELGMPIVEVQTPYRARPVGSVSKLSTFRDGFRILWLIGRLVKEERPAQFFTLMGAVFAVTSIGCFMPVLETYLETGLVPRFPTAIFSTGMMISALISVACGLILETVTRGRRESKRMRYLELPAPADFAPLLPKFEAFRSPQRTAPGLTLDRLREAV